MLVSMSLQFADVNPEPPQQVLALTSSIERSPSVDEVWFMGWMSDSPTVVTFPWIFNAP